MTPIVIDWDGVHIPSDLQKLPPGRYVVEPAAESVILTPEEEDGLIAALDQLDAGRGILLSDILRTIRPE